eukprot:scaffold184_cov316-Pinguiococcus_pyrenoidosus.AAC.11
MMLLNHRSQLIHQQLVGHEDGDAGGDDSDKVDAESRVQRLPPLVLHDVVDRPEQARHFHGLAGILEACPDHLMRIRYDRAADLGRCGRPHKIHLALLAVVRFPRQLLEMLVDGKLHGHVNEPQEAGADAPKEALDAVRGHDVPQCSPAAAVLDPVEVSNPTMQVLRLHPRSNDPQRVGRDVYDSPRPDGRRHDLRGGQLLPVPSKQRLQRLVRGKVQAPKDGHGEQGRPQAPVEARKALFCKNGPHGAQDALVRLRRGVRGGAQHGPLHLEARLQNVQGTAHQRAHDAWPKIQRAPSDVSLRSSCWRAALGPRARSYLLRRQTRDSRDAEGPSRGGSCRKEGC